jgi:ADP-heptose:LPS heptosyltransferase
VILVLRALGIGDLATAVPALRGLRRAHPAEPLWLAAPSWLRPLVELTGAVDRLVPVGGLAPVRWPPWTPCLGVNLHGRGPRSHRLLAAAGPDRLLGFSCPPAAHHDGPIWTSEEHEVARWCRLLRWYGIPAEPADLDLRVPDRGGAAGVTVVHPGAKDPARRWPAGRYAAVARSLAATGHRVVITGSAGERALAGRVADLAGLPEPAVLAGRTGLAELAGLIARARLVVCGDTGVGHLATAYGTPSVQLFGPVPPRLWGPPADRPWHRALWHAGPAGGPPVTRAGRLAPAPALAAVGTDEVLAAAVEVGRCR